MVSTTLSHTHTQSKSSNSLRTTLSQSPWAQTLREISNVCLPVTLCPIVLYWFFFLQRLSLEVFFAFFLFPLRWETDKITEKKFLYIQKSKQKSINWHKKKEPAATLHTFTLLSLLTDTNSGEKYKQVRTERRGTLAAVDCWFCGCCSVVVVVFFSILVTLL